MSILVNEETGTGEEFLAKAIHQSSARARGAFIPVNCTALPDNVIESDSFDYEGHSFTGATAKGKKSLVETNRIMKTNRDFEERIHAEFAKSDSPSFVYLYAGEEAAGTGIMIHLNEKDRIASTHHGHGHCIAKGVNTSGMMADIYGKDRPRAAAMVALPFSSWAMRLQQGCLP